MISARNAWAGLDRRRQSVLVVLSGLIVLLLVALGVIELTAGHPDRRGATEVAAGAWMTTTTTTAPRTAASPTTAPSRMPAADPAAPRGTAAPTTVVTTPTPSVTTASTTQARSPSAVAAALGPFLAAAVTLDAQLREATAAIEAAGPPWATISPELAGTVSRAVLGPVEQTIPAGTPPELLRSVLLVYSDLSSRRHAMQGFAVGGEVEPYEDLVADLANGDAAAARFDADLGTLRGQVGSAPPFVVEGPDARSAAEVLLRVAVIEGRNGGCGSRGGFIATELADVRWLPDGTGGTIDGIAFTAARVAGAWEVQIRAC